MLESDGAGGGEAVAQIPDNRMSRFCHQSGRQGTMLGPDFGK